MICSFITLVAVSKLFNYLFDNDILDVDKYDTLGIIERRKKLADKLMRQEKNGIRPQEDIPMKENYRKYEDSATHC